MMGTMTLRLPLEMLEKLGTEAESKCSNAGQLVRQLIKEHQNGQQ